MSGLKSRAEVKAQYDATNESVNLLQLELGDELNNIRKRNGVLPPFQYDEHSKFVVRWVEVYDAYLSSWIDFGFLSDDFNLAVQYMKENQEWRKRAVRDKALGVDKSKDIYVAPPLDTLGSNIGTVVKGAVLLGGIYLVSQVIGKK
jgi:hypothetical protein